MARMLAALLLLLPAQDLDAWRDVLRPSAEELRFTTIDWAPTFLGGVRRAAEEERPLLFWAMNGHPLGCT